MTQIEIPLPAGAEKVYDWHDVGTDESYPNCP